jgi:hypothetical protein
MQHRSSGRPKVVSVEIKKKRTFASADGHAVGDVSVGSCIDIEKILKRRRPPQTPTANDPVEPRPKPKLPLNAAAKLDE